MRIADAGPTDVDALADLAARTFPLACPPGSSENDIAAAITAMLSPERFAEYVADPDRVVRVAVENDTMIGYALFVLEDPSDADVVAALTIRPSVEVSKMYVDPAAHGTGTAAALMDSGADLARDLDRRALWLGVNQQNTRARRFYEKCGFVVMGPKSFMLGTERQDDFVMQKTLS